MSKKVLLLSLICFYIVSGYSFGNTDSDMYKTLIIYDTKSNFGEFQDVSKSLELALGHFKTDVETMSENDYKKGDMIKYDIVMCVNVRESISDNEVLDDLGKYEGKIVWIGKPGSRLSFFEKAFSVRFKELRYDVKSLISPTYSNGSRRMSKTSIESSYAFSYYDILDGSVSEIITWADSGGTPFSYILKSEKGLLIGSMAINGPVYYSILDSFYELYTPYDLPQKKIFLRLEDVHPMSDQKKLREITDYLYSENIPFMVALIPAFQKSDKADDYVLISQVKGFAETIQYMQDHGGSVILHGFTHAVFGMDDSGEGFEFWDGPADLPLETTYGVDMNYFVTDRLGRALDECLRNDIFPLAFESPHYAASQAAYKGIGEYFSTYCGHIQTSDNGFSTTEFPFVLNKTEYFEKVIPENLGYIDITDESAYMSVRKKLEEGKLVREYFGGAFYHPYLGLEPLKPLVNILKNSEYTFYDMKMDNHWVEMEGISIRSQNGKIDVNYLKDIEGKTNKINSRFTMLVNVVMWFLIVVIIVYYVIIQKLNFKIHKRGR